MKNNTKETKEALLKALSQIPQDNSLSEVRYHLRVALDKLENVEKKRERREVNADRRELSKPQGNPYGFDPFRTLQAIDEEIAKEKKKIEEIQRRRNQPKEKGDNDEFQTILD